MADWDGRGADPDAKKPVDPGVKLPPGVAAAAAAAEAAHKAAYPTASPEPAPAPTPPAASPEPAPAPTPPAAPARAPVPETGETGSWEHRYLAMKGRHDQAQLTIGGLQEQMGELGDELMRSQVQLRAHQTAQNPADPTALPGQRPVGQAPRLLTDADRATYGDELIDFIQRAAKQAVAPDIQQTQQQVRQVSQRVGQVTQADMLVALDAAVPDWKTINNDARFKAWCRLPDVYSGQVKGTLLNKAFQAADAPRVVAFFKGFLTEEQATGQLPVPTPKPQVPPAPREAAVTLESLAAPGRPKPAGGNTPSDTAEKPVFTRTQISDFYTAVRRQQFVGREQEKANIEAAIFAAQREGRVR